MNLRVTPTEPGDLAAAMRAALERKQGKGPRPADGQPKTGRKNRRRGDQAGGQVVVNRGAWKPGHR